MSDLGLLIFDLDGTLVDTMDQHAAVFACVLYETCAIPPELSRREYVSTAGRHLDDQFRHVLQRSPGAPSVSLAELTAGFLRRIRDIRAPLFPDTAGAITVLADAGYALAVTSSTSPPVVESRLRNAEILPYFSVVLGTDKDIPYMAKGEGHFHIIRERLHYTEEQFKRNAAFVGDTVYDMQLARRAGVIGVARVTGNNEDALRRAGAVLVVHDLLELCSRLRGGAGRGDGFLPVSALRAGSMDGPSQEP